MAHWPIELEHEYVVHERLILSSLPFYLIRPLADLKIPHWFASSIFFIFIVNHVFSCFVFVFNFLSIEFFAIILKG